MAVGEYALTTLEHVLRYLGMDETGLSRGFIELFHDGGNSATAATVAVSGDRQTLTIVITGGPDAGTTAIDLSAAGNDTLSELVVTIQAISTSLFVVQLGDDDFPSTDLFALATASMFGESNRQTLFGAATRTIENLIDEVTAELETFMRRKVLARDYTEWYSVRTDEQSILLNGFPINSITRIGWGSKTAATVQYDGTDIRATVRASNASLILESQSGGTTTTTTKAYASFATIQALVDEINDNVADWSAAVIADFGNYPTADLRPAGATDALDRNVDLDVPEEECIDYDYESETGEVFIPASHWSTLTIRDDGQRPRNLFVSYNAGLSNLPDDLAKHVAEIVGWTYNQIGNDPTLIEERLGDYRYKRAVDKGINRIKADRLSSWIDYTGRPATNI